MARVLNSRGENRAFEVPNPDLPGVCSAGADCPYLPAPRRLGIAAVLGSPHLGLGDGEVNLCHSLTRFIKARDKLPLFLRVQLGRVYIELDCPHGVEVLDLSSIENRWGVSLVRFKGALMSLVEGSHSDRFVRVHICKACWRNSPSMGCPEAWVASCRQKIWR